jgi:outer membrane protein
MNRRSFYFFRIVGFALVYFVGTIAFADHPNEGSLSLEQLLREAESQNLDLKEADSYLKASEAESKSQYGKLMPQLSIEGGPLATKFDDDKNSGTVVYGKADWNLYRGGRDQDAIDKSKIKRDLDRKKYEAVKSRVVREISRVYYELLFLLEGSALKEKALEMNKEQMKLAKLKKSSGFTSSADVIEFELREATLNSDLKMFSQVINEKSRELSVLLGRKDSSVPNLVKGHLKRETLPALSRESILSRLKDSNIEIAEAQADLQMSQKDASIAKSGFLPAVDLEAKYGRIANEERVFSDNNNYSVMLKVSVPLFSGFETINQTRAANANVAAKDVATSRKSLSAYAETENLFSQLSTLSDRLNLEEKNLSKSEDYYKITLGEYKRGVKNSPDMVGASERLLEARIRNLEYRKDYFVTKLRIYELVGSDPTREETSKAGTN